MRERESRREIEICTVFLIVSVATILELSPSVKAGSTLEMRETETFHSTK